MFHYRIAILHAKCLYVCMCVCRYYTNNPARSHSSAAVTRILSGIVTRFSPHFSSNTSCCVMIHLFIHSVFSSPFCLFPCIYPISRTETVEYNSITTVHVISVLLCHLTRLRKTIPYISGQFRTDISGQSVGAIFMFKIAQ